jgi:hypothetical protein
VAQHQAAGSHLGRRWLDEPLQVAPRPANAAQIRRKKGWTHLRPQGRVSAIIMKDTCNPHTIAHDQSRIVFKKPGKSLSELAVDPPGSGSST